MLTSSKLSACLSAILLCSRMAASQFVTVYCSADNTGEGQPSSSDFMSAGKCHDLCLVNSADAAFGVVRGKQCWCSAFVPGDTVSNFQCSEDCPGYPPEQCGNPGEGLYSYIRIENRRIQGTIGADYPSPTPTSVPDEPDASTVTKTVPSTNFSTVTRTSVTRVGTSITTSRITETTKTVVTDTIIKTKIPSYSTKSTTITTRQITTISGEPTTRVVVTTATFPPSSSSGAVPPIITNDDDELSPGAAAGIAVAVLLIVLILAACVYCFCCRPRRRRRGSGGNGEDPGLNRNTSVLSKVGLLRNTSVRQFAPGSSASTAPGTSTNIAAASAAAAAAASSVSQLPPRLQTDIPNVSGGPSSAATIGTMQSRRDSRPLFVDHRLNPNALMTTEHPSTTSLGTLHDNEDYSRPLEVKNPDPR